MADDTKPKSDEIIVVNVRDSEGGEVMYKLKKTAPLRRLIAAYCQRNGISQDSVRFLFDGNRINGEDTPAHLEMENDSQIDVAVEQKGG